MLLGEFKQATTTYLLKFASLMDAFDKLAVKTARRIVVAEEKRKGSQESSTLATAQQILAAIKTLPALRNKRQTLAHRARPLPS